MKTFIKKCLLKIHRHFPWIITGFFELVAIVLKRTSPNGAAREVLQRHGLRVFNTAAFQREPAYCSSDEDIVELCARCAVAINQLQADDVAHEVFYKQGFHLLRKHYYLPIPDENDAGESFLKRHFELIGLDMNDACALDFLDNLFPKYNAEFRKLFPIHKANDPEPFHLINGTYMAVDAHVYYALIRHFKPRRVIEIGAGRSTQLAVAAAKSNALETGVEPAITVVEPFPSDFLKALVPNLAALVENKVQQVSLDLFTSLEPGDILFIDSTHALREGGDVHYEYLEILPRLRPGVLVHIHDVSLPKPYPRVYFENRLYWNEQYLLQAFLAFNRSFEVLWPGNYMMLKYPRKVLQVFPEFEIMRESFPMSEPSAFWMRVRDQANKDTV